MKVIDLLNKIANGEEVPKRIRIDHWCYEFEWIEHLNCYYDEQADINLMSCLSMDQEEFNYEVHELKQEDKKIENIDMFDYFTGYDFDGTSKDLLKYLERNFEKTNEKLNEIINYINKEK